jgi:flagellar motor switch protein FliN/FliY
MPKTKLSAEDEMLARLDVKSPASSGKDDKATKGSAGNADSVPAEDAPALPAYLKYNFEFVQDVPLTLSVEFGRARVHVRDFLEFKEGYVLELNKMAGEPLELYMNGRLLAKGEVVVTQEKFGIRLTDIIEKRANMDRD